MPPPLSVLLIAIILVVAGVIVAFLIRRRRAAAEASRVAAATAVPQLTEDDIAWRIGAAGDRPPALPALAGPSAHGAALAVAEQEAEAAAADEVGLGDEVS
ncbi:MAG: hypothetical protein ACYC65_15785, partial [Candidatus Limnocylindrales bacterium]